MAEIIHVLPADIEKTSFRIIEEELRQQGREIPEDKKHVILRAIHTRRDPARRPHRHGHDDGHVRDQ